MLHMQTLYTLDHGNVKPTDLILLQGKPVFIHFCTVYMSWGHCVKRQDMHEPALQVRQCGRFG